MVFTLNKKKDKVHIRIIDIYKNENFINIIHMVIATNIQIKI